MGFQLYDFQEDGCNFLVCGMRRILADDMGLGKTPQVLSAIQASGYPVLITGPNISKKVWERHIADWDPGKTVRRLSAGEDVASVLAERPDYLIINYELLRPIRRMAKIIDEEGKPIQILDRNSKPVNMDEYVFQDGDGTWKPVKLKVNKKTEKKLMFRNLLLSKSDVLDALKKIKFKVLVFDEAHALRNRQSLNFTTAKDLCKQTGAPYLFLVTGTPILDEAEDIWTSLHLIDPKKFSSFWNFVGEHCKLKPNYYVDHGIDIMGLKDPDDFQEMMSVYCLRRTKKDYLPGLPEKTIEMVEVEMSDSQRHIYDMMRERLKCTTHKQTIYAGSGLERDTYLREICVSPDLLIKDIPDLTGGKIEAVLEYLAGAPTQQFVIFSQYAQAVRRLQTILLADKFKVGRIIGDDKLEAKESVQERFQRGDLQIVVATLQACGVAIDLTAANIGIMVDFLWTPALNSQAIDRIHRNGLQHPVTIYGLYTPDSIEEHVLGVNKHKEDVFDSAIPVIRPPQYK